MTTAPNPGAGHPALVLYPQQAAFGRTLPKSKLYEYAHTNTRLKNLFVQQVEQIVWQYKLAPETVNLAASPGVPEIQIFGLQLKTPDLNLDVLRCIDVAVQFPIVFELTHEHRVQVAAAYKRPNEVDARRWVLSEYFGTGWLPGSAGRDAMPLALHLGGLYEQLLRRLIPVPARPQESLAEHVERVGLVTAKQRDLDKAAARLAKERQFNRKVGINADLRKLQSELDQLRR